ncbi:E3 ubiquitin-protein ligase RNF34 [Elysia marginata]|uniref:E3 ubiquitin-protein ligase RNF34 n=1 Tax=Elysia marginata TaxID=1093978 RepID=A0AAV4EBL6_9GAST|nr:E3 ubiquitin-protein ligase RNF34 [Elysia marginata]
MQPLPCLDGTIKRQTGITLQPLRMNARSKNPNRGARTITIKAIIKSAKKAILRGARKNYRPYWTEKLEEHPSVVDNDNSTNITSNNRTAEEVSHTEAGRASQTKPKSCAKSSPSTNMSCELCSVNFTFFKRKKYCVECHRYFCSTCLPKPPSSAPPGRQCSKCRLLLSGSFTRTDLQNYKVKDIRCFLKVKNISMTGCKEKHDLVELVITHFCTQNGLNSEETEHEVLVRQMAAHMRNVSFVREDREGSPGSETGNTNTSAPDQRPDILGGTHQAASPSLSTAATITTNPVSESSSASTAAKPAATTVTSSSSSSSTIDTACASSSSPPQPSSSSATAAAAENNTSKAAEGEGNSNNNAEARAVEEDSTGMEGLAGLEEDLEERINNLNTDRLRELLEAMERLQETFAANQEEEDEMPAAPAVRRTQLDDVKAEVDVENLTVRQLKELLVNNFVDYRGCCERSELVEKVKNLWRDHQENIAIAQEIQEEEEAETGFASASQCLSLITQPAAPRCTQLTDQLEIAYNG